jgi:predicted amidophosphoribosyltransferase
VHRLKYQGLVEVAAVLAAFMIPLVPSGATALVPVVRARVRVVRFGIDPAVELAAALSRRSGLPLQNALEAPLWWPRHATRNREGRNPPRFRAVERAEPGAVLVDDVSTSGATLQAAFGALGSDFRHGIVATAPGRVRVPAPIEAGEVAWR